VQPRLLEQTATPPLARDDVAVDRSHVGGEGAVEDRAEVREQLVPAVGARGDDRVGGLGGERFRPGGGLVGALERDGARVAERARKAEGLRGEIVLGLDEAEDVHADSKLLHDRDDARRRVRAFAQDLRLLPLSFGDDQPQLLELRSWAVRRPCARAASALRGDGRERTGSAAGSGLPAPSATAGSGARTRRALRRRRARSGRRRREARSSSGP
jgi:hypothetical protein